MCGGTDAGGSAELHNMQSLIHNASEYTEELWRYIGDALEKCRVQYTGSYSDTGETTLVMVKGPAHLWSSFFMGQSEE